MSDFKYLKNSSGKWLISAPKRANRPDQEQECPFEGEVEEIFSIGEARVVANVFPFAGVHEVIIHSRDHSKDLNQLTPSQAGDILKVFRARFALYKDQGQVYIFSNRGKSAGESLSHPHSQLVVIPNEIELEVPPLMLEDEEIKETPLFYFFCPKTSEWPDEVWIAPQREGRSFYESTDQEIKELAIMLPKLIKILGTRHGSDFPYNFYIYPGTSWYLRLIPRLEEQGGFEIGTKIFINTQDPKDTFEFLKKSVDR